MPTSLKIVQKFFPHVTSVVDGKKPVHVEVTKHDSKSSTVKNHKGCALAVACKRSFKADGVVISVDRAYLIKDNKATRYMLPPSTSREVVAFDRGTDFAEGEYLLSKPPKYKSRAGEKRGKSHGNSPDYTPSFKHQTSGIRFALGSKKAL
jgi:hypothetical protein